MTPEERQARYQALSLASAQTLQTPAWEQTPSESHRRVTEAQETDRLRVAMEQYRPPVEEIMTPMKPVKGIRPRLPEIGRIRLGEKAQNANGKTYPRSLNRLRFTSPDRFTISDIAELYGGEVSEWPREDGDNEWQVTIEAPEVDVTLTPDCFSQHYEIWSASGCTRRCDGETMIEPQAEAMVESPCACNPDKRDCDLRTRISMIMPQVPHGAFRLDTGSVIAAEELYGSILLAQRLNGDYAACRLAIKSAKIRRGGKTQRFNVPVLRVGGSRALPEKTNVLTGEVKDPGGIGQGMISGQGDDPLTDELFGPQETPLPLPGAHTESDQALAAQAPPNSLAARVEADIQAATDVEQLNHVLAGMQKARAQIGDEYGRLHRLAIARVQEVKS